MNISFNWLKDLINIDQPVDEVAQRLTSVGLAVESVHAHGGDFILDIDLTSNRPDCLSHFGVARELGVIFQVALKAQDRPSTIPVPAALAHNIVAIEAPDLCQRFTARIIRNVKVGPSPNWLVDRLEAIGERSINSVADVTNYVMHELGQPMHAFDLDTLSEGRIVVRRSRPGERLMTLKDIECELDPSILAICDAEKPVAIGGIVGGLHSSISDTTSNVLLEVAYFSRESIRSTSRKLGLMTEASYRFERGVDPENVARASTRATELICDLAGGEAGEFIDVYPNPRDRQAVSSTDIAGATERLTGVRVSPEDCDRILEALGFERNSTTYLAPSWRYDIAIEEDLVEEVIRHIGYDQIADELPPAYHAGDYQKNETRERLLRQTLACTGFDEALSYSFIDTTHDETFEIVSGVLDPGAAAEFVELRDSVIEGATRMRPTILPGLLDAIRLNNNFRRRDIKLFEIGTVFAAVSGRNEDLPNEQKLLALAMTGGELLEGRELAIRDLDLYDAKGAVEAALDSVGLTPSFLAVDVKHLRQGQSASVSIEGVPLGYVGRLSDEIAAGYKFRHPVYVAELNLQTALEMPIPPISYTPPSRYPSVIRDVSFIGPRSVNYETIRRAVEDQSFGLLRRCSFVDTYEGEDMPPGDRSITVRLEYRSEERTLLDEEVEAIHQQIISAVLQKLPLQQR